MSEPTVAAAVKRFGRTSAVRAVREALADARKTLSAASPRAARSTANDTGAIAARALSRLVHDERPSLVRVLNATGVVIHTNLGRAPLPESALRAVAEASRGYSNLEYDLRAGERGNREVHTEGLLRRLLEVEAAAVVNNCAAAVLLAVNTFAEGRHVLVSRGELVEIGGSFRIPEILRKGGATLREVGTTNRTRLGDYRRALDAGVGLILRVHPSNFRIVGFTESPGLGELADLARSAGIPLVEDLGSGMLAPLPGLESEPTVRQSLTAGADVVTFSGDKLLGGPQSGIIAGRAERVDAMRGNPLYRALRVDKMTLAALHATLIEHESGRATAAVPAVRMLSTGVAALQDRAVTLAQRWRAAGMTVDVIPGRSTVGGGAAPTVGLETSLIAVDSGPGGPDALSARLRAGIHPVVARIQDGRLVLDLRTIDPGDDGVLTAAVMAARLSVLDANPTSGAADLVGGRPLQSRRRSRSRR